MLSWWSSNGSSGSSGIKSKARRNAKSIEIDGQDNVRSVAFLVDGKHIVSGSNEGMIRRWRVKDGKEVGAPMDAGSGIYNITISRDGKQVVSGTKKGLVTVWDAETQARAVELRGHDSPVRVVDVSPDGLSVATGSDDYTACLWSLFTGAQLLEPWIHDFELAAVRFSPDGLLIATATWRRASIRVYNTYNGKLLFDVPLTVRSRSNGSLAWTSNSNQLFTLSNDGNIRSLDVLTGTMLLQWPIHSLSIYTGCIALANNGAFIAASDSSSVSFWDTTTQKQIGSIVEHTTNVWSMTISANFDLAMVGGSRIITLCSLGDVLPSHYLDANSPERSMQPTNMDPKEFVQPLPVQEEESYLCVAKLNLIHASDAALDSWRRNKLLNTIEILSREMTHDTDQRHLILATRAFLRARLRQWDFAVRDARKSVAIQPTMLAYVAISMARFGRGDVDSAKEAFSRLFYKCDVDDVCFVALIKALVMFTSGHREEGMVRVADLIVVCPEQDRGLYHAVQVHMRLRAGKACVDKRQYNRALELLSDLQDPFLFPKNPYLDHISLMFGWSQDSDIFKFTHYQQRCEALYALGRQKEAMRLFGTVFKDFERQSGAKEVKVWLREFTERCPVTVEDVGDVAVDCLH